MKQNEPEYWEKQLADSPIPKGETGFSKELMRKIKERVEMQERPKNRRWLRLTPLLAISAMLVFGFFQWEHLGNMVGPLSKPIIPIALEPIDAEKEMTLKVAYFHENTFMMHYGKAYTIRYPNVEVKVITMGDNGWNGYDDKEKTIEMLEKEKPDVIYLSPTMYGELAKEGRLYPLDAVMKQDNYDLNNIYSGVTDALRMAADGKLYGLSPEYEMNALFYNKDLFDKYGVPYPKSGMSWEETLQLAARFPVNEQGNDRIYGLMPHYYDDASQLAEQIGKTMGLSMTNADGNQVTLRTDAWTKTWSLATDGYIKGYVYQPKQRSNMQGNISMVDLYKKNPFITGKAAMAYYSYSLARDMEMAKSQYKMNSFNWDIVSEPVDPSRSNESSSFMLNAVYAVNAQSEHQRAAWEMVKLINSAEIVKKMNRSEGWGGLSVRLQSIKPEDGRNYTPFYSMKPSTVAVESGLHPRVLRKFKEAYSPLAVQQVKAVVEGRLKLDEALKQLQEEAQKGLISALLDSRN
ncbi:multiple sugar transport system substrate-binding protein [Paenibacillus sp. 1_12]|uniref:ABC transporter substrate-binding protein n=1 Tax=Paenibacillus sp. 1_12 TaxID=1566278 RepID=UPI0008E3E0FC|nr:extracellular solute-binding protein [Paenibacillus sp. 1_12]SFM05970.1 multiple sugar transport system substrate-binding protein [Paenibacillus sp. 1_12]